MECEEWSGGAAHKLRSAAYIRAGVGLADLLSHSFELGAGKPAPRDNDGKPIHRLPLLPSEVMLSLKTLCYSGPT